MKSLVSKGPQSVQMFAVSVKPITEICYATSLPRCPELQSLSDEFADIFKEPTTLPPHREHDHPIHLKEGTSPINVRPYCYPVVQKDAIKDHVRVVLGILRQHTLYAKLTKCVFGAKEVEYLGDVISERGVQTDPNKIKAMSAWPEPKNVKELRGF
ncbi:hypothetical protein MLD38_033877 [Melastoma candidum]|uniref:Uncharacterized protein n=1 Tax=Melastoma candidum TaxID=119954 RepID=A0ACB9MCK2_9MYRT|nr:hypothetical protein MLD38_033877 [Melastoma candidum]